MSTSPRQADKTSPPAENGEMIGGYRLDSVIARGGMGCVYAATHLKLERKVAIKVLLESLAKDAAYVERFFHEARIVNAVRHPNIIDIYDFIEMEAPHRIAYVMEMLLGQTLKDHLALGPMTETQAVNVALQLTSALQAVHEVGVIHRDLKPANVIITAPIDSDLDVVPSVKLLDFGVAKRPEWLAQGTAPGKIAGTPAYMAPEQIDGDVSPAIDVYALGAIIYEMLTGERMFKGDPRAVLMQKLGKQPVTIVLPPDLYAGERFAALLASCLDPRPEKRPSLPLLTEALDQILRELVGVVPAKTQPKDSMALVRIEKPWPKPKPQLITGDDATLTPEMTSAIKVSSTKKYVALGGVLFALAAGLVFWARGDFAGIGGQNTPTTEAMAVEPQRAEPAIVAPAAENHEAIATDTQRAPETTGTPVAEAGATEVRVHEERKAASRHFVGRSGEPETEELRLNDPQSEELEPAEADPLKKDDILPW